MDNLKIRTTASVLLVGLFCSMPASADRDIGKKFSQAHTLYNNGRIQYGVCWAYSMAWANDMLESPTFNSNGLDRRNNLLKVATNPPQGAGIVDYYDSYVQQRNRLAGINPVNNNLRNKYGNKESKRWEVRKATIETFMNRLNNQWRPFYPISIELTNKKLSYVATTLHTNLLKTSKPSAYLLNINLQERANRNNVIKHTVAAFSNNKGNKVSLFDPNIGEEVYSKPTSIDVEVC